MDFNKIITGYYLVRLKFSDITVLSGKGLQVNNLYKMVLIIQYIFYIYYTVYIS